MRLALAGDTMLGRKVGEAIDRGGVGPLFSDELVEVVRDADAFVLNLECAISSRGAPWPEPGKPFFFRAPPTAVEALVRLGVDCVTLANNHALDFGYDALLDTFTHLEAAGIAWVGAGPDLVAARAPVVVERAGGRLGVVGVTDHPASYGAGAARPGVAHADLRPGVPDWLSSAIGSLAADVVLVTPHWGPNMSPEPSPSVRAAASALHRAGATVVAGHSAHVFHGVEDHTLYDLGDFIDDYATDPWYRNDLGLVFLLTLEEGLLRRIEAVPIKLDYCRTVLAGGSEAAWIQARFRHACADMGTEVAVEGGRLVVDEPAPPTPLPLDGAGPGDEGEG